MRKDFAKPGFASSEGMKTRPVKKSDIPRIREIVLSSGNFTGEEVETAIELAEEAVGRGESSGYIAVALEAEGRMKGYVCYGPTPLTDGVYDLYWIAVDSLSEGKGYGRALLQFVEEDVRNRGGRMLLIETSSQDKYAHTIRFYERAQYTLAARIRNFYRIGDDKLIYLKELRPAS